MKLVLHSYNNLKDHSEQKVELVRMEIIHIPDDFSELAQLIEYDPLSSPYGHTYNMALKGTHTDVVFYVKANFITKNRLLWMYNKHTFQVDWRIWIPLFFAILLGLLKVIA